MNDGVTRGTVRKAVVLLNFHIDRVVTEET